MLRVSLAAATTIGSPAASAAGCAAFASTASSIVGTVTASVATGAGVEVTRDSATEFPSALPAHEDSNTPIAIAANVFLMSDLPRIGGHHPLSPSSFRRGRPARAGRHLHAALRSRLGSADALQSEPTLKILVVGGTLFLGRAIVEHALAAGHEVALFNRGRTNPGLFPEAKRLVGDRDGDLSALEGRRFDAVIDPSAYFPRQVTEIVDALEPIDHYTFVSSCSVYADHSVVGADEGNELLTVEDPSVESLDSPDNYGGFKAMCEAALEAALPGRCHHVRAGLIVGPHDPTGRFTYWVERLRRGGDIVAPEPQDQPVQFIDVGDLAAWILGAADRGVTGPLNATGPRTHTMASMLDEIERVRERRRSPHLDDRGVPRRPRGGTVVRPAAVAAAGSAPHPRGLPEPKLVEGRSCGVADATARRDRRPNGAVAG